MFKLQQFPNVWIINLPVVFDLSDLSQVWYQHLFFSNSNSLFDKKKKNQPFPFHTSLSVSFETEHTCFIQKNGNNGSSYSSPSHNTTNKKVRNIIFPLSSHLIIHQRHFSLNHFVLRAMLTFHNLIQPFHQILCSIFSVCFMQYLFHQENQPKTHQDGCQLNISTVK